MKTEDCSKVKYVHSQPESSEKLMGRREALNKVGLYALSTATMMVLMKSQPARAQSLNSLPPPNTAPKTEVWQRTTRK